MDQVFGSVQLVCWIFDVWLMNSEQVLLYQQTKGQNPEEASQKTTLVKRAQVINWVNDQLVLY